MLDSCHCGVGHRERRCTTQGSMGLSLLLFLSLHMGSTMHTPSVIQTPTSLNVTEGSTLDMKCRIDGNLSKIFLNWYKNGIDELQNSTEIYIIKNETDRSSHFILETADIADSGTYVCKAGNIAHNLPNNGTQVTINEITGFKVNQTPSHISKEEGADVTLECHFRTVGRNSTMCVRWCKGGLEGELTNKTGSCRITQNLRKGFASLTLMNANVSDSGSYTCEVRRESRNHWESGSPSAVVITKHNKQPASNSGSSESRARAGIGAGIGAGAGTLLLLLLLSVFVCWRYKKQAKGTPVSTSETEAGPTKEGQPHSPVANQESNITYAALRFNRKEVQPDAEVIYAEVRTSQQQQSGEKGRIQPQTGHSR
ncbi:titin-like isoform X1 [Rhineura floridana]|uniref:titin-like isoform X1 n=1 Tax=Rhineura floridana TaxID=261503 RepID=UPI002AC860BF|nr:titin-like isoform X1 [Rhineura floridana]